MPAESEPILLSTAAMALPVLSYMPEMAFTMVTGIDSTSEGPMLNIAQFEQNGRVTIFHALLKRSRVIAPARDEPTAQPASPSTTEPDDLMTEAPLVTADDALAAGASSAAAAVTCSGALTWLMPELAPGAAPMEMKEVAGGPTVMRTVLTTPEVAPKAVSMMVPPTPTVALPAATTDAAPLEIVANVTNKMSATTSATPTEVAPNAVSMMLPPTPTVALPAANTEAIPLEIVATVPNTMSAEPSATPKAGSSSWKQRPHVVAQWKPHTDIRLQWKKP